MDFTGSSMGEMVPIIIGTGCKNYASEGVSLNATSAYVCSMPLGYMHTEVSTQQSRDSLPQLSGY